MVGLWIKNSYSLSFSYLLTNSHRAKALAAIGFGVSSRSLENRLGNRPAFVASLASISQGRFAAEPGGVRTFLLPLSSQLHNWKKLVSRHVLYKQCPVVYFRKSFLLIFGTCLYSSWLGFDHKHSNRRGRWCYRSEWRHGWKVRVRSDWSH